MSRGWLFNGVFTQFSANVSTRETRDIENNCGKDQAPRFINACTQK